MVDIGGDLRCWGAGPGGQPWTVGLEGPQARLRADDLAIATSGPRDEGFDHIVGGTGRRSASVAAPTAAEADALATALCALPACEGLVLAGRLPGMEARVVEDGIVHATPGWSRLTLSPAAPPPRLIRAAAAATPGQATAGAPWPAKFAVSIDYELPRKGARAYSPYVAIWVTDENSKLVRGLTMLGDKLDYVSENYIWWRRYGRSHPQVVAAISRPTHRPGKYTVVWDGKDDMGMPAPQGRYTIHVEATREDGLHSYQAMDMMLGADPVQATGPTGDELGPSAARYGPR
jgi:thiamine biosynthesis lipoprotein